MKTWKKHFCCLLMLAFALAISLGIRLDTSAKTTSSSLPTVTIKRCEGISYNAIGLLIDNASDYYSYELYRASSKNGAYKLLDTMCNSGSSWTSSGDGVWYTYGKANKILWMKNGTESIFVDSSVKFNKTYYYKIRLTDGEEKGKYSSVKSAGGILSAPEIKRGYAASSTQVRLAWQQAEGAQGYYIYRKEGKTWKRIAAVGKKVTAYTDKRAKANKTYSYRIRAYRKSGGKAIGGQYSSTCKVTTKAPTVKGNYRAGSVYGPSLNSTKLQEVRRVVQSFKDNHIKSGMSDYEKVLSAYTYIRNNCDYAWRGWQYNGANTAWGALVYGEAQCSGYARGMKALCDGIGIPCYYVHANSASANPSHQWNEVKVGGKWYILDAQGGFFLVSANTYQSISGMKWNTSGLPACKSDHKYGGFTGSEM